MFITHASCFNSGIAQTTSFYPLPWIQEIKLPDHYLDIPNRSFHLDGHGRIFLGKENGLTIISSDRSVHLPLKGPVHICGSDSDTLFYACENDLGLVEANAEGGFVLRSFHDLLLWENKEFSPSQIVQYQGAAFVVSERGIYRISGSGVEHIHAPGEGYRIILYEDLLAMWKDDHCMVWDGNSFIESNADWLPDINGFDFLQYLPNGNLLGTSAVYGLEIRSSDGKLISIPGLDARVPRKLVQVAIFNRQELWLLGKRNLLMLRHPSPLKVLDFDPGMNDRALKVLVSEDHLLLGTGRGVYRVENDPEDQHFWEMYLLPDTETRGYHLLDEAGHRSFAAGSNQLIAIENKEVSVIAQGDFTGLIALDADQVLASDESGLQHHRKMEDGWMVHAVDSSLSFAHDLIRKDGHVFLVSNNLPYRYDSGRREAKLLRFHGEEGLYKFIALREKIYLLTDCDVYELEEQEEFFSPVSDPFLRDVLLGSEDIIHDSEEGYWFVKTDENLQTRVIHAWLDKYTGREERIAYPILQNLGDIIGISLKKDQVFLMGAEHLAIFTMSSLKGMDQSHPIRISQTRLPRRGNAPGFHLYGLEFQRSPLPEFRYRVEPGSDMWSPWSQDREISFDRLRAGHYALRVQGRDLYGNISLSEEFEFTVRSPIYLSWLALIIYGISLLFILFLLRKFRMLSYQKAETRVSQRMQRLLDKLRSEKEQSDKLVADILPEGTAAHLRSEGRSKWDKYERATVLFSDIQGFTKIAEEMNPETLIDELDQFFFHFDSVVEKYNIEKIKTIGDAYMAAGGIPKKNSTNPVEVVLAALEMQAYMQQLKASKADIWDLRIGIHTGPVIAGVVGHKKMSYDIWGDTVNTASRMESSGMPGKVNISGITYGMVKDYFMCEYRGKLPVKYKGNIDMYFVNGLRPELAVDLKGIPNKRFFTKLQLLRLGDLEDKVFESLLTALPSYLHFHSKEYARKVYNQSFLLSRAEEIEQDERLLVRTATLMLCTGLTESYVNFENRSVVIARDLLQEYAYTERQVDRICNLILATKQPFQPNNQLEKIVIDSKMEYLGKPDYTDQIKLLFQELREAGVNINGQQFKRQQLELLYGFEFFTTAASRLREVGSEEQASRLENERWI